MMDTASAVALTPVAVPVADPPAPAPAPFAPALRQEVDVASRTWPGINKPGGHAVVSKIHLDADGAPTAVDVKYALGGGEVGVALKYVAPHVELARLGRSRRVDVKMNANALGAVLPQKENERKRKRKKAVKGGAKKEAGGAAKKRKALGNIDGNHGSKAAKKAKKSTAQQVEGEEGAAATIATAAGVRGSEEGEWTIIQDGKIADHVPIFQAGRRVAYWWSDEDGWLPGTVAKALSRVVTASTIKWTVKVAFENGDAHVLAFHPTEQRWKAWMPAEEPSSAESVNASPRKKTAGKAGKAKPEVNGKKTGEKSDIPRVKPPAAAKMPRKSQASKKPPATTRPLPQSAPSLSFGPGLQSRLKELSSKMHTTSVAAARDGDALRPSPHSVCAARAANAAPRGSLKHGPAPPPRVPDGKEGMREPSAPPARAAATVGVAALYKSECKKADTFVDYMTAGSPTKAAGRGERSAAASSPSSASSVEGDLELKLDRERTEFFNSLLTKVLFQPQLDMLDVEELTDKLNARCGPLAERPFTALEIRPYLQRLHDDGRIFLVEEEGARGVVYAI